MASGHAPEAPDKVEEAFDEITLPIKPAREGEPLFALGPRWNVGPYVLGSGSFTDSAAVVSLVSPSRLDSSGTASAS